MGKICETRGRIGWGTMTGGGSIEKLLLGVMFCDDEADFTGVKIESEAVFEEEVRGFECLCGLDKDA